MTYKIPHDEPIDPNARRWLKFIHGIHGLNL